MIAGTKTLIWESCTRLVLILFATAVFAFTAISFVCHRFHAFGHYVIRRHFSTTSFAFATTASTMSFIAVSPPLVSLSPPPLGHYVIRCHFSTAGFAFATTAVPCCWFHHHYCLLLYQFTLRSRCSLLLPTKASKSFVTVSPPLLSLSCRLFCLSPVLSLSLLLLLPLPLPYHFYMLFHSLFSVLFVAISLSLSLSFRFLVVAIWFYSSKSCNIW